ncbi:MAG: hypothetical protein KGJ60_05110 [Verrucomicrobiota bacterium]|nr:hypothetical protein [Verrucomicrobiota bacterium]
MNLAKWLIAGKSVMSGREAISYRVRKQFYLPKFGPARNPFTTGGETAPIAATASSVPVAPATKDLDAGAQKPPADAPPPRATKSRWARKLNPVSLFRAAPAGPGRTVVQPELSLDRVKVVHNDLSDADVDVVPIKSRPATAPEGVSRAKKPWELLGDRLLKATTL